MASASASVKRSRPPTPVFKRKKTKNSPVILIVIRASSIRNTIAQDKQRARIRRNISLHRTDKVPVHALRPRERSRIDFVPARKPARRPAPWMARDAGPALALLAVQAHCEHALGLHLERNFIRDHDLPARHCEIAFAPDGDGCERRRLDAAHACCTAQGETDGACGDGQIGSAKGVGDGEFDLGCADGHVERLAECGVLKDTA
jgi:hypothetical protein